MQTEKRSISTQRPSLQNRINEADKKRLEMVERIHCENVYENRKRELEERQKHDELIAVLREAVERGATITIGNNASGIQIQQNSSGANQSYCRESTLDYKKVKAVLEEIKKYKDYPQFTETFGDNSENVEIIIDNAIDTIDKQGDETVIKKSLRVLRDVVIGTGSSLLSTGILGLLESLSL